MFDPFRKMIGKETSVEKRERKEREARECQERERSEQAKRAGINSDSVATLSAHVASVYIEWEEVNDKPSMQMTECNTLCGHKNYVLAIIELSDTSIASGSLDKTIRIWNKKRIEEYHVTLTLGMWPEKKVEDEAVLIGHTGGVSTLAELSPGRLASGSTDKTIRIWDINSKTCIAILLEHSSWISALIKLQDSHLISSGYSDAINVWDVKNLKCVGIIGENEVTVYAFTELCDNRLVSGGDDNMIRIWNMTKMACDGVLAGHTGNVISLAQLSNNRLVSGSYDKTIRIWDIKKMMCATILSEHTSEVTALTALSNYLISGSNGYTLRLWDTENMALVECVLGATGSIKSLISLANGGIASCGFDYTIRLWNIGLSSAQQKILLNAQEMKLIEWKESEAAQRTAVSMAEISIEERDKKNLPAAKDVVESLITLPPDAPVEKMAKIDLKEGKCHAEHEAQDTFRAPIVRQEFMTLQAQVESIAQCKLPALDTLTEQLNMLDTRITAIRSLSAEEQATLAQQLLKDEKEAERLQERYTIERDANRKAYYYLIQTHIAELMVASLGVGSGYIDVNHSQTATVIGWVCDALSSAFPGVSTLTTIVNAGVGYLDTRYRQFLLDQVRIFGHTISESEVLGEEIARLLVRAHYHANTDFSSQQAEADASRLIHVIINAKPSCERTPDLAEKLVKALFKKRPCLDPLPKTYVAPVKATNNTKTNNSIPTSLFSVPTTIVPPAPPPPVSAAPSADMMQEILKRLAENEQRLAESERARRELEERLQHVATRDEVQHLKKTVDKIAPNNNEDAKTGHGLIKVTRKEEETLGKVQMTQERTEHRLAHVETHVGVVTEEIQSLREEVEELRSFKRQQENAAFSSKSGFYSGKTSGFPGNSNGPRNSP